MDVTTEKARGQAYALWPEMDQALENAGVSDATRKLVSIATYQVRNKPLFHGMDYGEKAEVKLSRIAEVDGFYLPPVVGLACDEINAATAKVCHMERHIAFAEVIGDTFVFENLLPRQGAPCKGKFVRLSDIRGGATQVLADRCPQFDATLHVIVKDGRIRQAKLAFKVRHAHRLMETFPDGGVDVACNPETGELLVERGDIAKLRKGNRSATLIVSVTQLVSAVGCFAGGTQHYKISDIGDGAVRLSPCE